MSKFDLSGKTAIVTGGGSGIGRSICETFARAGCVIHILDIDAEIAQQVVVDLDNGSVAHACDVVDHGRMIEVINDIARTTPIDIMINNAGVGYVGNLENTDVSTFDRLIDINVKGVYNGLYAVVPHMKQAGRGVILNMASTVSHVAIPDRFAYTASKGAVLTMTYSVALDYLAHGIRCNAIAPARVHTPFVDDYIARNYPGNEAKMFKHLSDSQPIGRMAKPHEIADLALYLCADESSFITGQCMCIDGGFLNLRPGG